jgi:hypothetical protein
MPLALLLVWMLWLPVPAQIGGASPVPPAPLRETFITAAETVIDDAMAVDVKADNDHFNGQMQQLKEAEDNLNKMADEDREHEIADQMKDLVFQISSCHIQAIDGTDTTKCQAQIGNARDRAMDSLGKRKSHGAWVDGGPA